MECLECKSNGKSVNFEKACSMGTHLWKTHGMSSQQYYDKYLRKEGEGICPECGKPTLFRTLGKGYLEFCSKKCSAKHIASDCDRNAHKVGALKETMQKQYNVDNPAELESVKLKRKSTMLERYDVEHYSQSPDFKEKYHDGCFERFGEISYARTTEWLERVKKTNNERYGADFWSKNKLSISTDCYNNEFSKYGCHVVSHPDKVHLTYTCDRCGNTMEDTIFFVNSRLHVKTTPCSHCFPKRNFRSGSEVNVENFICSLGIEPDHHERWFLGEYGADIVCEDERVIFEYDGLHWHTDEYHDKTYHLMKTEYAESMGYRLVHIFSDEWEQHEEIVKSRICQLLHRDIPGRSRKIYARNCEIVELPVDTTREFMDRCHIQGYCSDKYRYGLMYEGQIVAAMTFGFSRFAYDEIELLRYCNELFTNVVGGGGRLLAHFIEKHPIGNGMKLVTYADRRWSNKNTFYPKLGFELDSVTDPNYYYVNGNIRESRMKYQKHKLVEMGYDANMSEHEIMMSIGMHRIYDCGNYKYVWKPSDNKTDCKNEPSVVSSNVEPIVRIPKTEPMTIKQQDDPEIARYDEMVRPHGCHVLQMKRGRNLILQCDKCNQTTKIWAPIMERRLQLGLPPCYRWTEMDGCHL